MSQYFSAMFRRRPNEGWFRVGQYDATTVDIMCGLAVFTMFIYGVSVSWFQKLLFIAPYVRENFEVWRLITWPIATQPDLFALIGVIFFWVFGQQLEGLFGRNRFFMWVLTVTLVPSISLTILGAFSNSLDFTSVNFGLSTLFLAGIWVYAATYPNVRWFEIMPLWALAAIFTGLNLLSFSGARAGGQIMFMLISIAAGLSMGRSLGLATAWPIPHIPISGTPGSSSSGSRRCRRTATARPTTPPSRTVSLSTQVLVVSGSARRSSMRSSRWPRPAASTPSSPTSPTPRAHRLPYIKPAGSRSSGCNKRSAASSDAGSTSPCRW